MSKFRVELRDRTFRVLEVLDNEYIDLNWSYARIGGCGDFNFELPRKLFEEKAVSGEYNIQIKYRNPDTSNYDLWYQGVIQNKIPNVNGNSENISISGFGYSTQLSRIYVSANYTSTEVSVIVKSILDTYITPNTDITYDAGDIEATTFTVDDIDFEDDAMSAIQKLADLVGIREWGVDKDRKFFFKARSAEVGRIFYLGKEIARFNENQDFDAIVNRVYIQGKEDAGTPYFSAAYSDAASIAKYGLREKVITNSSISTNEVAEQFANATLEEFADVQRKANFSVIGLEAQIEATNPIDLVNVIKKQDRYGQKEYGTGLYSGRVNRVLNRINYSVTNNNSLEISVDAGSIRPKISEELSRLTYKLEQQRSSAL